MNRSAAVDAAGTSTTRGGGSVAAPHHQHTGAVAVDGDVDDDVDVVVDVAAQQSTRRSSRSAAAGAGSIGNDDEDEDEEEMVSLGLSRGGGGISFLPSSNSSSDSNSSTSNSKAEDGNAASVALSTGRSAVVSARSGGGVSNATAMSTTLTTTAVGTNRKSTFPATPAATTPAVVKAACRRLPLPEQQHQQPDGRDHHHHRGGGGGGASSSSSSSSTSSRPIRRTPGPPSAAKQAVHRRTPGAGHSHNDEADLNRSHARTPVMSGGGNRMGKTPHKQPLPLPSSSLVTPSNKLQNHSAVGSPNAKSDSSTSNRASGHDSMNEQNQQHHRQLYTPAHFTLAKNADLHMDNRPDAFSPATIRLTDSLEKILTDDDDFLEARQRALLAQQPQQHTIQQSQIQNHQKIAPNDDGSGNVVFDAYTRTHRDDIVASDRGAFRRIQSTGSSSDEEDSPDDEEMDEMKDLDHSNISEIREFSSQDDDDEEEDEAEISQINVDEVDEDDDDSGDKEDNGPKSRPKPLNLSGGAFQPPTKHSIKRLTVPTVAKAEGGTAGGVNQGSVHTPKPQRTQPYGGHPNQGHGGGMYYSPGHQQHHQHSGYFGPMGGGAEDMMGGGGMIFGHEPHPPSHHLQYSHPSHHQPFSPQYAPPHHQHLQPQNFHFPSMPSPQNAAGFGLPPTGVVSPLTIPPDYSHGYHHHPQANSVSNSGPYPHHYNTADFGVTQAPPGMGGGGGGGGDHWSWRGESPFGHHHSDGNLGYGMQHHLQHDHLHGFPAIAGHSSPDFSFHDLRGAVSPYTIPAMPHHPFSPAAAQQHHHAHVNNYPRQHHHQQSHGMGGGSATAQQQRTKSKERGRHNTRKSAPSPLPLSSSLSSPTKQQQHQRSPPGGGGRLPQRSRKDSNSSSVDSGSGAGSAFSGGDEQGSIPTFHQQTLVSSHSGAPSSSTSVLRQTFPGLGHSASSEEKEHSDWFYPSIQNQSSNNTSYSTIDSGGGSGSGAYPKQIKTLGRVRKGSHDQTGTIAPVINIPGSGNSTAQGEISTGDGRKQGKKQQHMRGDRGTKLQQHQQQHQHAAPPHLDHLRTKHGSAMKGDHHTDDETKRRPYAGGGEQFVMESPTERQAYKEFGRTFRQKENESLDAARDYALACLDMESNPEVFLPPATHWRVYLELADVAKRSNRIDDARNHYRQACMLQPHASQGWLEHSKLEEESGNLAACANILQEGLSHCVSNENLLIRAVKFYERMGKLDQARRLLSRLKHLNIDKSWKTMLEGALLEARAGRYSMAREVLKHLTHHVPWYGPLYLAHTKLERDYGSSSEAFAIVEKGLKELPRYGPLYFQAFRLMEKEDLSQKAYDLPRTMEMVSRADSISRELLWKVHLEAAQMQERAAMLAVEDNCKLDLRVALKATRRSYAKAIMLCPSNLSWKIWLASGRTEVSCGNTRGARDLFLRAYDSVSEKGRSTVLLECARLEEFIGDLALSRSILCKARHLFGKSDWKVWLSSVNLECRCGLRERAIAFVQEALDMHRGTGRLWAALIQLRHYDGELCQSKVLKSALQAVPKSGEVWCEGARIYLNPFSPTFDLRAASRSLSFASRFTPQYGDSFLEQLRLNMVDQWLVPLATPFINRMYDTFLSCDQLKTNEAYKFIEEHTKKAADVVKTQLKEEDPVNKDVLDTSELELRCSSADPNYGHLWFQCRSSPIDTAREVITQAKAVMTDFIMEKSYLYIAAMVRRAGVLMLIHHQAEKITAPAKYPDASMKPPPQGLPFPDRREFDMMVDRQLRLTPSLGDMLSVSDSEPIFAGISKGWESLSTAEKRRVLFGSDSLLS